MPRGHPRPHGREPTNVTTLELLVLEDYRKNDLATATRVTQAFAHLKAHFGELRVRELPGQVAEYIAKRRADGAKPATIKLELSFLSRGAKLACRRGLIRYLPQIEKPRVRNVRKGFFTEDEIDRVLAYLPHPEREIAEFAYLTGWRKGEILSLRWTAIDRAAGVIRLEPGSTKNGEGRTFPYFEYPQLSRLLARLLQKKVDTQKRTGVEVAHVFHKQGAPIRWMDHAWRKAIRRAGLENRLFHDLRRNAARNLERAGVPRSVAMKLLGHKTPSIFLRYAIPDLSDLRGGVRRLARLHTTIGTEVETPLETG